MPLYIASKYGNPTIWKTQNDLLTLVNYATNFGSQQVGGHTQVYINNPQLIFPQLIIAALTQAPYPIVIQGLNYDDTTSGGVLIGKPNATIAELGGAIQYCNYETATGKILGVFIEYDASGCNGQLYWIKAKDLTKAPAPPYLILAHEFGHLVGAAVSAVPTTASSQTGYGYDQAEAVNTENHVRLIYQCPQRSLASGQLTAARRLQFSIACESYESGC